MTQKQTIIFVVYVAFSILNYVLFMGQAWFWLGLIALSGSFAIAMRRIK